MKRLTSFVLAVALAGCAPAYVYRPTQEVTAQTGGRPASLYPIPPESPHGSLTVATFGVVKVQVGDRDLDMLHARLVVANNDDIAPWTLDTRQQLAVVPGHGRSSPTYVNTDVPGAPLVSIAPGQKRTIDLYYALPPGIQKASQLPEFDVLTHVQTPLRPVAERTPFERYAVDQQTYETYYGGAFAMGIGWGPMWWYDPYYPMAAFPGAVFVPAPHAVYVARPVPHAGATVARPVPHATTVARPVYHR